ncbi:MAG: UDP-N-acetylmuramate dehydrogenase [Phycisphaerales bacterium JB058]
MARTATLPEIERDAPIPTYFKVGGRADRMAHPTSIEELQACLNAEPDLRVLGDGANLLVDDAGVSELVVKLDHPAFRKVEINESTGIVTAGGGADLAKLIHACVRTGLTGIEGLIGVPASLGGAAFMNAGGAYGQMADVVKSVTALNKQGEIVHIPRENIAYAYRTSGLFDLIITEVELQLTPGDPEAARNRLKEIMDQKARTQPLAAKTCGCVFRNPVLRHDLEGIGQAHQRVGAGMLIDRAGGKGVSCGPCVVSARHANFIETSPGASASDILCLIEKVQKLVQDRFDVQLETEVVVWRRSS